ncbi:MAG: SoxR reducing system RseC family protein [Evtepia gabavorous]
MEQIAMVKSILDNGMAQVAVQRETACGAAHSCADCAGCEKMMTRTENVVVAYNDVNAHPGDVVKVQSENGNFFKTAAIVYLLPFGPGPGVLRCGLGPVPGRRGSARPLRGDWVCPGHPCGRGLGPPHEKGQRPALPHCGRSNGHVRVCKSGYPGSCTGGGPAV